MFNRMLLRNHVAAVPYNPNRLVGLPLDGDLTNVGSLTVECSAKGGYEWSDAQRRWPHYGHAGSTSGTPQWLQVADHPTIRPTAPMTCEFWYYPVSTAGSYPALASKRISSNAVDSVVLMNNGLALTFYAKVGESNWTFSGAAGTLWANQWNYISITRAPAAMFIHVNGIRTATFSIPISENIRDSGAPWQFMHEGYSAPYYGQAYGFLNDICFWNFDRYGLSGYTPPASPLA